MQKIETTKSPVTFKVFRAAGDTSWDKLLTEAAEFTTLIGVERVVNISHSSDNGSGTVVVWYLRETA